MPRRGNVRPLPPPRTERYDPVKPFGPCGAPPPLPPDGETPRTGRRGRSDRERPQADPGTGMGMGMGDRRGPERRAPPRAASAQTLVSKSAALKHLIKTDGLKIKAGS